MMMPKDLKVDPIDLHMSSDHMDMHHAELCAAHTAANGDIEAAQAGLLADKRAELDVRLGERREVLP